MINSTQRGGGSKAVINPILPETVRTGCYIIASKVMRSYYKGECTLDALSVVYFCANDTVLNWCSYMLEELLVACEEAQEKGGTFTYGYLLFCNVQMEATYGKSIDTTRQGVHGEDVRALAV